MKTIKSHFEVHTRFRNGIFLLTIVLLVLMVTYYWYPYPSAEQNNFKELTSFQKQIDSLKCIAKAEKKGYEQRPFNPNFISEYKGYILGLTPQELDKIYTYREQGKWINSVTDFKRVTGVSDELLTKIKPLFKFPEWIRESRRPANTYKSSNPLKTSITSAQKKDLNQVTATELYNELKVPDFIAARIVKVRERLGGFINDIQLKDVAGLYDYQRSKILSLYTVKSPVNIEKIHLNTASVKELMKVPYFDFETALEIRDLVEVNNGITNFEELGKIKGFSLEKIDRIALYLTLK